MSTTLFKHDMYCSGSKLYKLVDKIVLTEKNLDQITLAVLVDFAPHDWFDLVLQKKNHHGTC